tara:strand:- start:411 stop:1025 length:615 start_codon:yes stop_codon:yes gene_type:complete
MKMVIATHNRDKLKELKRGLSDLDVDLVDLSEFPEIGEIIEDGETLKENAFIKARHVFNVTGLPSIADDTGLEVEALDGKPGVHTARFAGENCSYSDNINKMLDVMENIENSERTAEFKTVMAFVDSERELFSEGTVKGMIAKEIKGLGGFGYDPIFYISEQGKTFAEMTLEMKNKISHRGRAVNGLKLVLSPYLTQNNSKESA